MADEEMSDKARRDAEDKLDRIADSLSKLHGRMDSYEADARARKDSEEKEREDRARHDMVRKDKFGHRKDGESYKDWKSRHDADEKFMAEELGKNGKDCSMDARRARKDAEDEEREKGGEDFKKWADEEMEEPGHREDKHRKDAEGDMRSEKENEEKLASEASKEEKKMEEERNDSVHSQNAKIASLEALIRKLTTEVPASERDALAAAQSRADSVAAMFGERASAPIPGETPIAYRKRQLAKFQRHSPAFKEVRVDGLDEKAFGGIEEIVYNDAMTAARNPAEAPVGILVPIVTRENGRDVTRYSGDPIAWMLPFMSGPAVGRFKDVNRRG